MKQTEPHQTQSSSVKRDLVDGALVAALIPATVKIRTAMVSAKKLHGSYFSLNGDIVRSALSKDKNAAILGGAVAGVVFFVGKRWCALKDSQMPAASFRDRVMESRAGSSPSR